VSPLLQQEKERREQQKERFAKPTGRSDAARRKGGKDDHFHALKMQTSLAQIPIGTRVAVKKDLDLVESFEELPLLPTVKKAIEDALPGLEYRVPTPAQRVAIPALLGMTKQRRTGNPAPEKSLESFLLAAETGSGKTLAYLLPIVDAIKRAEAREAEESKLLAEEEAAKAAADAHAKRDDIFSLTPPPLSKAVDPARPRAIILVPTAELVTQVGLVAKKLSHVPKYRTAPISAANSADVIRNRLFSESGVDIVVSTPPLLASIASSTPNILSRVTHLVIDEADSLFDRSFKPSTTEILERCRPSLKQLILCSATIPRYLDKYLADHFPAMNRLVTPNLHAIPRRVQLGVIDVAKEPYRGNKLLACADTIWQIGKASADYDPQEGKENVEVKRIMVFVNEREDTNTVAEYLQKKGVDAMPFHRDTDPARQAATLAAFTGNERMSKREVKAKAEAEAESATASTDSKKIDTQAAAATTSKRHLPNTKVIVTTDLGSRGIDTVAVRYVILYDVPHTTIDFIHRLGRTGRMGRRGRGIVLVGPGDRSDVVKEVREAMYRGEALI